MKKFILILVIGLSIISCSENELIEDECGCLKETFRSWQSVSPEGLNIINSEKLSETSIECQNKAYSYTETVEGYFTITCE